MGPLDLTDLQPHRSRAERTLSEERLGKVKSLGAKASEAEIERAATDFEALLLQQMLQSMWNTVPQNGMLTGSREESMYRDMLNEQIAQAMASGPGLGIKDMIARDMRKTENK
jgi:flagellar protein FlgJ